MKSIVSSTGFILLLLVCATSSFAQTKEETALSKAREAIQLMDQGKIDESMKLLEEAQKLDPKRYDYPYELALAHFYKEEYKEAIKILEKTKKHPDVTDQLFQLLGNCYDILGETEKAFEAYDSGLKKFPNSGAIYLEKGNVYWGKKEFGKALSFYEKGIEVQPTFSSNYYRASRIYLGSTEEIWGLIYGELFMNLERNSKRTAEISKLIYDTYKSQITFTSDTSMSISFCQNMNISLDDSKDSNQFKLPFCMIYEPTLMLSLTQEKEINLTALDRIRTRFVENYFQAENNKTYPILLFDYQYALLKAGHLEAYNHWILMKGDEDAFDAWIDVNKEKWDGFVKWFTENPIQITETTKFYSGQY